MVKDEWEWYVLGGLALIMIYLFSRPTPSRTPVSYAADPLSQSAFGPGGKKPKNAAAPATTKTSAPAATKGSSGGPNWDCITHRERLQIINNNATVTGTVIAAGDGGAHYAPDGDLVFSLKPDPQYAHMLLPPNTSNKKYGGGLWIEGVCQKANKAKEPRHQGDCKCSPTKFQAPKNGQRLKITGAHIKDVGEDGHSEIHPVYTMDVIG